MATESYVQLPQDSVGKKLRTNKQTIESSLVEEQVVRLEAHQKAEIATYGVCALDSAVAASKHHLSMWNSLGSNKWLEIILVKVGMQATATVAGFPMGFRLLRTGEGGVAGISLTPAKFNTGNADLPAQVYIATGAVPSSLIATLAAGTCNPEESGGHAECVLLDERINQQPLLLKESEGITIQQYATAGVGVVDVTVFFRVRPEES